MRQSRPERSPLAAVGFAITLAFTLALVGCGSGAPSDAGAPAVDTVAVTDTIVSTASALIGRGHDLDLGLDDRLYLADATLTQVLSIRPDGADPRTFGREGDGPGEFNSPRAIAAGEDGVWVFDAGAGTVQMFSAEGEHLSSHRVEVGVTSSGRSLDRDGNLAYATGGLDSVLVGIVDPAGEPVRSFGTPVAPPVEGWDFTSMKERIDDGQVPDEFRNDALPVWTPDGSLYLAFYAEPLVRRYSADGTLVWSRPLEDPVLESTRAAFVRNNREETSPFSLFPLRYVRDAQAVGSELWLLLNATEEDDDGVVLVLDGSDGTPLRRMILRGLPGAGPFVVDRERGRMYLVVGDEAMMVAADLDEREE